jgi:hypothetical protein
MTLGLLAVCTLLGGCVVNMGHGRHRRRPPPPPVEAEVEVEWGDVRWVMWSEYYGCDDATIVYLRNLRGYDDADILFLLHVALWKGIYIRDVMHAYVNTCNRSLFSVALHYRIPTPWLFVDLSPGMRCPPPYGKAYGYYWNRKKQPHFRLTDDQCRRLIELKIAHRYYGFAPATYFEHYTKAARGWKFKHVARVHAHSAGKGGKNVHGKPLKVRKERPWVKKAVPKPKPGPKPKVKPPVPKPKAKPPVPKPKPKAKPPAPKPKAKPPTPKPKPKPPAPKPKAKPPAPKPKPEKKAPGPKPKEEKKDKSKGKGGSGKGKGR